MTTTWAGPSHRKGHGHDRDTGDPSGPRTAAGRSRRALRARRPEVLLGPRREGRPSGRRRLARGAPRRDLRPARRERQREIDAHPRVLDAARGRRWPGQHLRPRRARRRARGAASHQPRVRRGVVLQEAVRDGEPRLLGPPLRRRGVGGAPQGEGHPEAARHRGGLHDAHRSPARGGRQAGGRGEAVMDVRVQGGLAYAFVERQVALMRRYWLWEIVWVIYSITTSLSVAYIGLAQPIVTGATVDAATTSRFVLYLLVGTIAWRFLGIVYEDIAEIIAWERWEGTIEYTCMAPVPRLTQLLGMAIGTVVRAAVISIAVLFAVMLFIPVDLSHANALSAF